MSKDSRQVELDEISNQNDKSNIKLHPHIRQLGIQVPDGWEAKSLGEIGELDTSSVNKKSNSEENKIDLVNYMDVYNKYHINNGIDYMEVTAPESQIERSQVRPGDILFTPSSEEPGDIGNSAVVTEEMENTLHSYHTVRLRPTSDNIQLDMGFSGWFANAPYVAKQFARRATGSTRYTLTLGDFSDTQVLIPPLPEQRKIATVLYTIDRTIEKTEEIINQGKEIRRGVIQYLLTSGIDKSEYRETRIGPKKVNIPFGWGIKRISDIADIKNGNRIVPGHEYADSQTDYPFIRISDMKNGTVSTKNIRYLKEKTASQMNRGIINSDEVYVTVTGRVGDAGTIPEELDGAHFTDNAAKLYNLNNVTAEYLSLYLRSKYGQDEVHRFTVGSNQPKLSMYRVEKMEVLMPPINEQRKIVETVNSIDNFVDKNWETKRRLEYIKQGLMQDLLSGKVRTTDTNIEVPDEIAQYG